MNNNMTPGYPHPKRWVGSTNVSGSISLPNIRPTFKKSLSDQFESPQGILQSQFQNNRFHEPGSANPVPVRSRFRSNSMPSLVKRSSSSFFDDYVRPYPPVHIPSFVKKEDSFKNGSNVQTSSELIVGALRAGLAYFQRGMHYEDILALVRSASSAYNTDASLIKLERALEKLVASGIVSKSLGGRPTLYRLVIDNPNVASISPSLYITGTRIQPTSNNVRIRPGQCLPGGISHLTRPACSGPKKQTFVDSNDNQVSDYVKEQPVSWMQRSLTGGKQDAGISTCNFDLPYNHLTPPCSPRSTASFNFQDDNNEPSSTFESFSITFGQEHVCEKSESDLDGNLSDVGQESFGGKRKDMSTVSLYPSYDTLLERLRQRLQA